MRSRKRAKRISRRALVQLGMGIALVTASVGGVTLMVDRGAVSTPITVVTADTGIGVSSRDVEVQFVDIVVDSSFLPTLSEQDWEAQSNTVTNRPLRAGDVVSTRDFSLPNRSDLTGIGLDLSIGQPAWLAPGRRVTLWVASPASENSFSAPFVVSANVMIESVSREGGFAIDEGVRQVSVLVGSEDIPDVLHALANGYFLALVPQG